MLSNEDIIKEIGKGIIVYPISVNNIRGNSLNLRASAQAWSVNGGEFELDDLEEYSLTSGTEKKYKDNANNNEVVTKPFKCIVHKKQDGKEVIIVPPHDTALIETLEVISVNYRIGGTYHSKVGWVSQGIGHIGTTLDPGYTGQSLIALHNHSNKPIKINVGDTFVTVVFNYLNSLSTYQNTNSHGHVERLTELGIVLSSRDKENLNKEWKKSRKNVRNKMIRSSDYKKFREEIKSLNSEERWKNKMSIVKAFSITILIIGCILFILHRIDAKYFKDSELSLFNWFLYVGMSGLGVIFITSLFNLLKNKFEGDLK